MKLNLPPDEYYLQLAKVPSSASAIIRNEAGEFLMVKRTYKDGYAPVGGMLENDETPSQALVREVKEELGIQIKPENLICLDFIVYKPFNRAVYIFDCGVISEKQINEIKIDTDEISEWSFLSAEKVTKSATPNTAKRIQSYLNSLKTGSLTYLENSEPLPTPKSNYAFIDCQNLYLGIKNQGWSIDYSKFRVFLKDKYNVEKAFLFIGYVKENEAMYKNFRDSGYILIFKPILPKKEGIQKGNCDAELILHAMTELNNFNKAIIVSGDGDFYCVADYLKKLGKLGAIIVPNENKYSALLKGINDTDNKYLIFLNQMKSKIEYFHKKKKAL